MPTLLTLVIASANDNDYFAVRKYPFPDFYNGDASEERRFILNVAHCFEQAINQVGGKIFGEGGSHDLYLFSEADVMEGGIDTWNYITNVADTLPQDVMEAARILVKDFFDSRVYRNVDNLTSASASQIDFSKVSPLRKDAPRPKMLTVGDRVYDKRGRTLVFGRLPSEQEAAEVASYSWNEGDTVIAPEEMFVPADLVDAFIQRAGAEIEAYPTPNQFHRRGQEWFARFRKGRKYEHFASTKKEAIFQTALAQQFDTFWA